ncbi:MAG: SsrA-binding protein SmpB [Aphanocapsa feldmannii 277cV]|uniref:SsrA-binding protein n=2 Tax=Aphanocapsa feldmannii TaxID=192050 RepID=A0A524RKY4_9CHRO|nr:MAG: SsrA-binding protein SmpB [Aphanocapsa feldmannii 288cV]TGG90540.1 MAG: SsrA-binding protein SmpB [Aphanocapsa feldmannii 277cV]TGH25469.1 MAG: SsrA-binding protein SmpB [Aphanocapsa feldmannii 277cI]
MARGGNQKKKRPAAGRRTLLADNRIARRNYEILETIETGIELLGTEVKSIRAGNANLRDGFVLVRDGQFWLHNVHISPHDHAGSYFNHEPLRKRRLLAHRREIDRFDAGVSRKGLTVVPLNLHLKGSWIKLSIALARGKNLHDKRQDDRARQDQKDMRAALARR